MSALAFDPWAALKVIRGGCPPANSANPAKLGGTNRDRLAGLATLAGIEHPSCKTEEGRDAEIISLDAIRAILASDEYAAEHDAVVNEPEPDHTPLPPPAPVLVERLAGATGASLDAARTRLEPLAPLSRGLLVAAVEATRQTKGGR